MMNRRRSSFQSADLEEGKEWLENPARGWYGIYTFLAEQEMDPEQLRWSLRKGETLALIVLDIGSFRRRALDPAALERIRSILLFFAEEKRDVILRPVYDREGFGMEREPETFDLVLTHLSQIGELLQEGEHSVCIFQGLLIGSWGELHHSRYLAETQLRQLYERIRPYLGETIYLAVRTPAQWRTLSSQTQKTERLTLFDDGMFGSASHMGTFGTMTREAAGWKQPWSRKEELEFLGERTITVPCGGEAIAPQSRETQARNTAGFVVQELRMLHVTYLNRVYDRKILDQWEQMRWQGDGIWSGSSLIEYVGAHLGYRILVKRAEGKRIWRNRAGLILELENIGFGTPFQEGELVLLCGSEAAETCVIPFDIRTLIPGKRVTLQIRIKWQEGPLFLQLRRKKDGQVIRFANKNSADTLYLGSLHCETAR